MANELAIVDVSRYAIMRGTGAAIMRENLAGDQITASDLPHIKVPSSGSKNWELPPDGTGVPSFDGIIIYTALQKTRWEGSTPTPGTPPICAGRVNTQTGAWLGMGIPGGDCKQCPYGEFGSEIRPDGQPGRGKACSDKRICLIATSNGVLPAILYVPATSLSNFKKYLLGLDARYQHVVTHFALEQDKSASGIVYSKVVPSKAGNISSDAIVQVTDMINSMTALFQQIIVAAPPTESE